LHGIEAQPQAGEKGGGSFTLVQQAENNVFGTDRVMAQSSRLDPGILERTLRMSTERVRIDPGLRMRGLSLTQSGLASSISMMGMPSSTW
jgi:hypothetical protein